MLANQCVGMPLGNRNVSEKRHSLYFSISYLIWILAIRGSKRTVLNTIVTIRHWWIAKSGYLHGF